MLTEHAGSGRDKKKQRRIEKPLASQTAKNGCHTKLPPAFLSPIAKRASAGLLHHCIWSPSQTKSC